MILEEKFTLSNGGEIPKLGLGTWVINDKDVVQVVKAAARIGYRHIDTAQAYGNESGVVEGIKACGVKCLIVVRTSHFFALKFSCC